MGRGEGGKLKRWKDGKEGEGGKVERREDGNVRKRERGKFDVVR